MQCLPCFVEQGLSVPETAMLRITATLRPPCSEEAKQHRKAIVGVTVSNPSLEALPTQAPDK